jgi:hypothetical protein
MDQLELVFQVPEKDIGFGQGLILACPDETSIDQPL